MKLVVGLGNPGKKYEKTRHNLGFRIIDALEKSLNISRDNKIILLKPDTFMNRSGKVVKKTLAYYKIPVRNLFVVQDEIDLPFGSIRVSTDSSSAGHKGVQSIINELKTKNFTRIRIGIRQEAKDKKQETSDFVLENFSKREEKELEKIIKKVLDKIGTLLISRS